MHQLKVEDACPVFVTVPGLTGCALMPFEENMSSKGIRVMNNLHNAAIILSGAVARLQGSWGAFWLNAACVSYTVYAAPDMTL